MHTKTQPHAAQIRGGEKGFHKEQFWGAAATSAKQWAELLCRSLFISTYAGRPGGATSLLTSTTTLLGLSRWREEEREEKRSSSRSLSLCLSLSLALSLALASRNREASWWEYRPRRGWFAITRARRPRCRYRGTDWNRRERRSASYRKHRGASAVHGDEKEGLSERLFERDGPRFEKSGSRRSTPARIDRLFISACRNGSTMERRHHRRHRRR